MTWFQSYTLCIRIKSQPKTSSTVTKAVNGQPNQQSVSGETPRSPPLGCLISNAWSKGRAWKQALVTSAERMATQ